MTTWLCLQMSRKGFLLHRARERVQACSKSMWRPGGLGPTFMPCPLRAQVGDGEPLLTHPLLPLLTPPPPLSWHRGQWLLSPPRVQGALRGCVCPSAHGGGLPLALTLGLCRDPVKTGDPSKEKVRTEDPVLPSLVAQFGGRLKVKESQTEISGVGEERDPRDRPRGRTPCLPLWERSSPAASLGRG